MRFGAANPNWKGGNISLQCQRCRRTFHVVRAHRKRKFCSRECAAGSRWIGHQRKYRNPPPKRKPIFLGPYSRLSIAYLCGHLTKKSRGYCALCTNRHKRSSLVCPVCGKEKIGTLSDIKRRITCSQTCYGRLVAQRQRGAQSHLWRGGLTASTLILRGSAETTAWRRAVFARDNYACTRCGATGKLSADHIKPWALYPELRWDIGNGRTLCWPCHKETGFPGWLASMLVRHWDGKHLDLVLP